MRCFALLAATLLLTSSCSSQSQGKLIRGAQLTEVRENLEYYLYYPPGYPDNPQIIADNQRTYGLLVFLHGGGDAGNSLEQLKAQGPPKRLLEGPDLPFLVLAPQHSEAKTWWNTRAIMQLVYEVVDKNQIDPDRIYLSGLSRGASACWELAVQNPDYFAALGVVCGMLPTPYAHWLNPQMPIWMFHGTEDEVIPFSESEEMAGKLKSLGYDVRFTVYEGMGHTVWDKAYADPELFEWLAAQRRK